jgi:glycosyltransferase involved in cell wall biosynthesis
MRLSICLCTYNRAHVLPYCLEALTKLKIPPRWNAEILVVDNNSTDNTKSVVDHYSGSSPIDIHYFHESEQGISAARNRAIKESHGDYLGFLDDECVVKSDWIEIVTTDIAELAPPIIGGPYVGALLPGAVPPKWYKVEYGDAYFIASKFERGYQRGFRASGGNMFVNREICTTYEFAKAFGQKGDEIKVGEEVFLQERFLNDNPGAMIFYEPRIEVTHYILPTKFSLLYHAKRQMEVGACHLRIRPGVMIYQIIRTLAYLGGVAPFRMLFRDRERFPYWQNYVYEQCIPRVMPLFGAASERVLGRYR